MTEDSNSIDNIKLCECGCGTELIKRKWWRPSWSPRFIRGHHLKGRKGDRYRGGKYDDHDYECVYMPQHPFTPKNNYVRIHRLVVEAHIGRYLTPKENIHHIDGNKRNNDISNLQIVSNSEHQKITHEVDFSGYFCSDCKSNKTKIEKNGKPHWYDDDKGGHLCRNCFRRKLYKRNGKKVND
jgi:hypothetical protein